MSIRPKEPIGTSPPAYSGHFQAPRRVPAEIAASVYNPGMTEAPALTFDDLTPTEQAAASLGVSPDGLKPIAWLNDAHYQNLKETNALEPNLVRRIEAFKHVSKTSADAAMMPPTAAAPGLGPM